MVLSRAIDVPKLLDNIRTHHASATSASPSKSPSEVAESREIRRGLLAVARAMLRMSVQPGNYSAKRSWAHVQVTEAEECYIMHECSEDSERSTFQDKP